MRARQRRASRESLARIATTKKPCVARWMISRPLTAAFTARSSAAFPSQDRHVIAGRGPHPRHVAGLVFGLRQQRKLQGAECGAVGRARSGGWRRR